MGSASFNINRRHFLKGTTAAAVLSSFGMYGFEIMNREKPWRVGLIGTGWYGTSDLFKLIQVANVEVIALCDVDSRFLNEAATLVSQRQKSGKKPKMYSDYRKMLADSGLEIVLIGTPDHWHALQCIDALKSGAHVYVQKPISVDVMEGEAMVAAARHYNKTVQVGTQRKKYSPLNTCQEEYSGCGFIGQSIPCRNVLLLSYAGQR